MKKQVLAILLCIGAMLCMNNKSNAQTLMYYWSFNSWVPVYTTATPGVSVYAVVATDCGAGDTAKARWVEQTVPGTSAAYSTYADVTTDPSDTLNAQCGMPPGNCFRARNPDDSTELLIYAPTTGYSNIKVVYACEKSSEASGDSINVFSYSVDSGTNWSTTGLSETWDTGTVVFRVISVNVNDTAANNKPGFVFRIQLAGLNSSTGGNNRFDNVTVWGLLGGPSGITPVNQYTAPEYTLFPNPASNNLSVTSNVDGEKTIMVYDIVGNLVLNEKYSGKELSVNTSNLNAGMYMLSIKEETTGTQTTQKFIKQ